MILTAYLRAAPAAESGPPADGLREGCGQVGFAAGSCGERGETDDFGYRR
jgi:hypothetical protein